MLVALAGLGFCGQRLWSDRESVGHAVLQLSPAPAAAAIVLAAMAMAALPVLWWMVLAHLGEHRSLARVGGWYFAGEMGKYVPGGIWAIVGRSELARRDGVTRARAYASVVLSLGLMVLGMAVAAATLVPLLGDSRASDWAWLLVVPLLGVISQRRFADAALAGLRLFTRVGSPSRPPLRRVPPC